VDSYGFLLDHAYQSREGPLRLQNLFIPVISSAIPLFPKFKVAIC